MSNGTPCVIVEGSGRVADILANAADLPMTEITIPFIQKQLRTFFAESYNMFSEREIILWTKKVQAWPHVGANIILPPFLWVPFPLVPHV